MDREESLVVFIAEASAGQVLLEVLGKSRWSALDALFGPLREVPLGEEREKKGSTVGRYESSCLFTPAAEQS